MSDDLLRATVRDLLADRCPPDEVDRAAAGDGLSAGVWAALEQTGLTLLPISMDNGGGGGSLPDLAVVGLAAGYAAAPVPLMETALLAGWALDSCGRRVPPGPLAAAGPAEIERSGSGWRVRGHWPRVAWAATAEHLVVISDGRVAVLPAGVADVRPGRNLAGEPRDDVRVDAVVTAGDVTEAPAGVDAAGLRLRGALGRALLTAGAARRALDLTVRYSGEREQFGRPLNRFQAVQQHLAEMAGSVALAEAAALAAARDDVADPVRVAVAKHETAVAAGVVARLAHQVHGALGFTREHVLRHATTRLWSWRDEFGGEAEWAAVLGGWAVERGPDGLWAALTSLGE